LVLGQIWVGFIRPASIGLPEPSRFIQISSIGGRRASVGISAYQSAKFAVEGFSEALSNEVGLWAFA
jgi:NAD(P)-dependent dehydrogenase (short-subunit alcohol dehydrogenase family)